MEDVMISLTILGFFALLFGFLSLMRYLSYRETMGLAEKGLVRADWLRGNGKDTLRWGIVIASVGLALCVGLYPLGFIGANTRWLLGLGPWMLAGLLPLFFGLGLILIWLVTREKDDAGEAPAPPRAPALPRNE